MFNNRFIKIIYENKDGNKIDSEMLKEENDKKAMQAQLDILTKTDELKKKKRAFILGSCEKLKTANELAKNDVNTNIDLLILLRKQIYQLLNQLLTGLNKVNTTGKSDDLIRKELESKSTAEICEENTKILAEIDDNVDECLNQYKIIILFLKNRKPQDIAIKSRLSFSKILGGSTTTGTTAGATTAKYNIYFYLFVFRPELQSPIKNIINPRPVPIPKAALSLDMRPKILKIVNMPPELFTEVFF